MISCSEPGRRGFFSLRLILNCIRSTFFFVGFMVSASLVAQKPTELTSSSQTTAHQGEIGVELRVIDPNGATIANAHVVARDGNGREIADGKTNQDGLLWLPRLAASSFAFSVSAWGFADFHSSLFVGPDRLTRIEVALKDLCDILNCDGFTGNPVLIDVIRPELAVVIEPYPIAQEPAPRQPGVFKRLLSRFRHRHN